MEVPRNFYDPSNDPTKKKTIEVLTDLEKVPPPSVSAVEPFVINLRRTDSVRNFFVQGIEKWTAEDVCNYFLGENFEDYYAMQFIEQEIDGLALLTMHREDLYGLDLTIGVRIKMWNHISIIQLSKT